MLAPVTLALALLATQAATQRTQSIWGQCGGRGYSGPTACQTGTQCKVQNEWYSQCLGNSNSNQGGGQQQQGGDEEWDEGDDEGDDEGGYDEDSVSIVSTVRGGNGNNGGGGQVTRVITTVFSVGPNRGGGGRETPNTAGQNRGGVTIVRTSRWQGGGQQEAPAPTPQSQQRPYNNPGATPRTTIRRGDGNAASAAPDAPEWDSGSSGAEGQEGADEGIPDAGADQGIPDQGIPDQDAPQ